MTEVDGQPYRIAGVAGDDFAGLEFDSPTEIWVCSRTLPTSLHVVARARPGLTADQARAAAEALLDGTHRPAGRWELRVTPAGKGLSKLRAEYEGSLWVLMILVTIALLIMCANLATLLTVRNHARLHELAVRAALGANSFRLFSHLLAENTVLAVLGGSLALAVAHAAISAIRAAFPEAAPALESGFQTNVLVYLAGVSLLCAFLFAASPVWLRATDSRTALKGGSERTTNLGSRSSGRLLLGSQIAFSVVL